MHARLLFSVLLAIELFFAVRCVTYIPNLRKIGQKLQLLSWTISILDRQTDIHLSDFIFVQCHVLHWTENYNKVSNVYQQKSSIRLSLCLYVCVCVCVCQSASISLQPLDRSSRNFVCRSPVAVARSSSGGVAICYVLPVLWMTSRVTVVGRITVRGLSVETYSAPRSVARPGRSLMSMNALLNCYLPRSDLLWLRYRTVDILHCGVLRFHLLAVQHVYNGCKVDLTTATVRVNSMSTPVHPSVIPFVRKLLGRR